MEITFDSRKRDVTLRERGLDFADAATLFSGRRTVAEDLRFAYPERRFLSAGWLNGRVVVVVWTHHLDEALSCQRTRALA